MPARRKASISAIESVDRPSSDLLCAYEHFARIDVLEGALAGPTFCDVSTLAAVALGKLRVGRDQEAAALLRAAEHISFAAQTARGYASSISNSTELRDAITAEFDVLVRRAELFRGQRTFSRHGVLPDVCTRTLQLACEAFAEGMYAPALELGRAAELLAEIAANETVEESERIAS